jgi:predicted dehydrogenase
MKKFNIAFIGLGVMGHRMLTNMTTHGGFAFAGGWDPSAEARAAAAAAFPHLPVADGAEAVITDAATDVVYIASPPASHRQYVLAAIDAGKTVYCEKPLGVDVAESRDMVDRVEASGLLNAVNFPFAAAAAVQFIQQGLADGALGDIAAVDLRLHFSQWPREWQVDAAAWLARREEGGFVREVVSHYAFLTHRLFGPAVLEDATLRYPDDTGTAETHLLALLDCSAVPVSIAASTGGAGPDLIQYTVWGSKASYRLFDWNRVKTSDGGDWRTQLTHIENPRQDGYMRLLDNFRAQLMGEPHTMASFREALAVQELIEEILAA